MATEDLPVDFLFNPFDPDFRIDPYSVYEKLRSETPIHRSPFGAWIVTRYADATKMLSEPHASVDERNSNVYEAFVQATGVERFPEERARPFLFMDPPDHTRLRGLVAKAFTPRVVEALSPRIQELVDKVIDKAYETGEMEVIEDLAYPLPVTVICEMLGVPTADHEVFKQWSRQLARSLDPDIGVPPEEIEKRQIAADNFRNYFTELIGERKRHPKDDLLSALIVAEEEGQRLTVEELLSTCILLLIAGHETTVNLIGNGVLALLRNQDQLKRFREDPGLSRTAVEEVLRYDPPVQMTGRIALKEMELGGVKVTPGDQTILLIGSTNRDPDQFESASSFDIGRVKNPHLAFSSGIHFCLGAPLARVEGRIALSAVASRLKELEMKVDNPEYKENIVLRGLAALPVSFKP